MKSLKEELQVILDSQKCALSILQRLGYSCEWMQNSFEAFDHIESMIKNPVGFTLAAGQAESIVDVSLYEPCEPDVDLYLAPVDSLNETKSDLKIVPPNWVAIPMQPTDEQWTIAQGTLLDHNWDAVTCLAARIQTLIAITRDQLESEIKALNV